MGQHVIYILFFLALGACIGSFLNVVVWRLPRGESLVHPRSHCPKCNNLLAWYDNLPVIGWIKLAGRCRHCGQPISMRYPIVEAICGLLFAGYYVAFFLFQVGPCAMQAPIGFDEFHLPRTLGLNLANHWPIFLLYLFAISSLLAASLIDAELFIIPLEICWLMAGVGLLTHALFDSSTMPGALNCTPLAGAASLGGAIGLVISILLMHFQILRRSFPNGEPMLEIDRDNLAKDIAQAQREGKTLEYESELPPPYTTGQIRAEMAMEMLFLIPPLLLAGASVLLVQHVPGISAAWEKLIIHDWASGFFGALLGALVGGFVVWLTRILGTLGFGRVAMGMGDVHLMFGVGAIIGAGASTIAFFLAPFFGMLLAIYMLITRKKRELPYGPYLSLASAFLMLFYCPIAAYLSPGMQGLLMMIQQQLFK